MSKKNKISDAVLSQMKFFLDNEKYVGQTGKPEDMLFLKDGSWLKDAAVIDIINSREGAWDIDLVFAHYKNPFLLIVRNITRCFSEQKAKAAAFYIRKEAAKDRRGTLSISIKDFKLCNN